MFKKCELCKEEKSVEEFNKKTKSKDGLQKMCRVCSNNISKAYYLNNKAHHVSNVRIRKRKQEEENIKYVALYLLSHPCVDCGEKNPIVLDFDHENVNDKMYNISDMITKGHSTLSIQKEIDKCYVRCSNCHRIKTAKQFNWRMLKYVQ